MYSVSLSDDAKRFFEETSAKLQQRLDRCFEQLGINPHQHPNIKSLKGNFAGYHRYRVGDYRVIYQIDIRSRHVFIITIVHRSKAYNN